MCGCYDVCMKRSVLRSIVARIFLSNGYMAVAFGWLWVLLVIVPSVIKSGALDSLVTDTVPAEPTITAPPIELSPVVWIAVGVVTLIILLITAIILVRIPRTIVHNSEHFVSQTAKAVMPVITHHKPLPVKRQRVLSRRIVLALQLLLSIVPLLISPFLPPYDELSTEIVVAVAAFLAAVATLSFVFAWLIEPKPVTTSRTRSHASRGLRSP